MEYIDMEKDCEHSWIFQETIKDVNVVPLYGGDGWDVTFTRVDIYFCTKCCKIHENVRNNTVNIEHYHNNNHLLFAPIWFK